MQVKRYIAADMRRALQKVREELGAEAIILSNRTTSEGVEVIASPHSKEELLEKWGHHHAIKEMTKEEMTKSKDLTVEEDKIERNPEPILKKTQKKNSVLLDKKSHSEARNPVEKKSTLTQSVIQSEKISNQYRSFALANDEIENLKNEIDLLKDLLKTQTSQMSWGNFNYSQPMASYLFKQMSILGFSLEIAFDWLEQVKTYQDIQQAWHATIDHLTQRIPVLNMPFAQDGHRIVALVGPAGSGKTTTLAKLAAQHILVKGKESIGLITTDTYRISAQEQLQTIGRIMEIPVRVADCQSTLDKILKEFSEKTLILVDTAGLTRHDSGWQEQYQLIKSQENMFKTLLVLPSSHQELVLKRALADFGNIKLDGCILSKLDEASSLGEIISIGIKNNLPIAYVTDGLSVPDDIHVADAFAIMHHAIHLAKAKNIEERSMIQLFDSYLNREVKENASMSI